MKYIILKFSRGQFIDAAEVYNIDAKDIPDLVSIIAGKEKPIHYPIQRFGGLQLFLTALLNYRVYLDKKDYNQAQVEKLVTAIKKFLDCIKDVYYVRVGGNEGMEYYALSEDTCEVSAPVVISGDDGVPIFQVKELSDLKLTERDIAQIRKIMVAEEPEFDIWTISPSSVLDDLRTLLGDEAQTAWDRVVDKEAFTANYVEEFASRLGNLDLNDDIVRPALKATFEELDIDISDLEN